MRELLALTPEQLRIAEDRLRNPAPGSRIEAAKKYGIDLIYLTKESYEAKKKQVEEQKLSKSAIGRPGTGTSRQAESSQIRKTE